jgi:glucosamine--fructose-6-phosphate aminotransferase (isomerizing)
MCGIGAYTTLDGNATPGVMDVLERVSYRGYDSAGVGTFDDSGEFVRRRAKGKLGNLRAKLELEPLLGTTVVGHTRWATHGDPTEENAHPHTTKKVMVVHNGTVENFRELLEDLAKDGYLPETQTDTEAVALWVTRLLDRDHSPKDAVRKTMKALRGASSFICMFKGHAHLLIAASLGLDLAVGYGEKAMYVGSDAIGLAPLTKVLSYLKTGDLAVVTPAGVTFHDATDAIAMREKIVSSVSADQVQKGNHRDFMHKEMFEQPEATSHTLSHYIDMQSGLVKLRQQLNFSFADITQLLIVACGTANYAGKTAQYWFERYAKLQTIVDIASEFRYRNPVLVPQSLSLFVSQSGQTADTLASLRYVKDAGKMVSALLNSPESIMAREVGEANGAVFPTLCGPEIGVASPKAFTSQLAALASLAVLAGKERGVIDHAQEQELVGALAGLPGAMSKALELEPQIEKIATWLHTAKDALYLGRGSMFPIALEGALKFKEISYIHGEGYAAGELKHGPIALIDEVMPVVVVAPYDELMEKVLVNMHEVAARGGRFILVTDEEGAHAASGRINRDDVLIMPSVHPFVAPILAALPLQLLAYHTALLMGKDVDQPRNLAKSVVVE